MEDELKNNGPFGGYVDEHTADLRRGWIGVFGYENPRSKEVCESAREHYILAMRHYVKDNQQEGYTRVKKSLEELEEVMKEHF